MLLSLQAAPAFGQSWTGGGTDDHWGNTANWNGGMIPDSADANVVFGTSNQFRTFLNRDFSVSSLTFASSTYTYQISGVSAGGIESDNALKIGAGGIINNTNIPQYLNCVVSLQTNTSFISGYSVTSPLSFFNTNSYSQVRLNGYNLTVGGSGATDIQAPLVGSGNITKTGSGSLTLYGNQAFTGNLIVNAGNVSAESLSVSTITNNAMFSARSLTASSVVNSNKWYSRGGDTTTFTNSDVGSVNILDGQVRIGSFSGAGTLFLSSELVTGSANRNDTFTGVISGTGTLTKTGGGTLTLLGNNTLSGSVTGNGGTIVVGDATHAATLGTGAVTNNAILRFAGIGTAKNSSITNNFILEFRDSATVGSTSITNGNVASTTNTAVSFLNNSSAGPATITNNKALYLRDASTASGASITNAAGSSLDISSRTDGGVSVGALDGAGSVLLGSKTLTVGSSNTSTSVDGVIQDGGLSGESGGGFTKTGTGTLTLSGYNTYTGMTTVSGGTLALNATPRNGDYYGATLSPSSTGLQINAGGNVTALQDFQFPYTVPVVLASSSNGSSASLTLNNSTMLLRNVTMGNGSAINGTPGTSAFLILTGSPASVTTTANSSASINPLIGVQGSVTYNVGSSGNLSVLGGMRDWYSNGAVTKTGAGTLTIGGGNSYSGATAVSAGNLLVNGNLLATGTVSVAGGATLSGLGSAGNVSAANAAIIAPGMNSAPGSGIGTLTVSSLSLVGGSILDFSLGKNGVSDQIIVNGDNNAATFDFAFSGSGNPIFRFGDASTTGLAASDVIGQSYKLVRLTGNASTNVLSYTPQVRVGNGIQSINGTFSVVNDGSNSYLTYSPTSFQPVPAPPAAVSLAIGSGIGLLGTGWRRLRRQTKRPVQNTDR